ncbi:hypothetical protein [Streptomyces sp. NPDC088350]|uniref:hypothetical protein n=1 Tax=Streptomyces sp. NPDC088350 TaxID=3365854 RepID=UPI003818EDA2
MDQDQPTPAAAHARQTSQHTSTTHQDRRTTEPTPPAGRGRRAARLAARLPLSRPVGLGPARPFARPARTVAMVVAVLFGVAAVTFATGLSSSLAAVIAAQPGTRAYYGSASTEIAVSGMSGAVTATAFEGDASWGGFTMVGGRWFTKAGEAVVPSTILTATGTKVGDTVTLTVRGKAVGVRIVGEVFDTSNDGRTVFTDAATLKSAAPDLKSTTQYVDLKPGTDPDAYVTALDAELKPLGVSATSARYASGSDAAALLDSLTALLTLLLVCVAALGVWAGSSSTPTSVSATSASTRRSA